MPPVYPILSECIMPKQDGHSFCLKEISLFKRYLEAKVEARVALCKECTCGVIAINGIDSTLVVASMGSGACSLGLLATVIAAPMVLGLEIAAPIFGIGSTARKFIGWRLAVKACKHDEIHMVAESK